MDAVKRYLPNLGECWILVLLMFVGSIATGALFPGAPQSLLYAGSMALPFIYVFFLGRKDELEVPLNKPGFGRLGAGPAFFLSAVVLICLSVVLEPATSFIPMPDRIKKLFEKVFYETPLWDSIISTCILAPVLEETLCRGVMLRGMAQHGSKTRAIVWSSILFAIMHANPWQSIPALLIGLFFGWVYSRTGCLWLTIFLHCLNNSISTAIARIFPDMGVDEGLMDVMGSNYWYIFGAAICIMALCIYYIYEKTVSVETDSRAEGEDMGL